MFEITEVQERILNFFLENHDDEKGISSYTIGKNGIPRRTFEINKNKLIENYLIEVTDKKRTGKQERVFYSITPLGFISLLKKKNITDIKKSVKTKRFCDFIPLIAYHWESLLKITQSEKLLLRILQFAIDGLKIEKHMYEDVVHITLTIDMVFPTNSQLNFIVFLNVDSNPQGKKLTMNSILIDTNQKLYDKIIDMLTFLFFYFLLGFYSTSEMYHGVLISFEVKKIWNSKQVSDANELATAKERWNRIHRIPEIVKYYKNNKEIKSLLKTNIVEFNKYFKKPENLLLLEKEL